MCVFIFQSAIKELILRDSFYAPEVEIFRAVCEWVRANPDEDTNDILSVVRLPLMSLSELLGVVRPAGLVSPDTILDAIQARTQARDSQLKYRGCLSEYRQLHWTMCWDFLWCLL
jgi:BTB/POZ domain-containing protein 9